MPCAGSGSTPEIDEILIGIWAGLIMIATYWHLSWNGMLMVATYWSYWRLGWNRMIVMAIYWRLG
jgi:hypothetical protein